MDVPAAAEPAAVEAPAPGVPPAHAPWEVAGTAYVGTGTPVRAGSRPPGAVFGARVRVRPTRGWAGEAAVGWDGGGVDATLTAWRLFGDPYAVMVPHLGLAGGVRTDGRPHALGEVGFGFDVVLTPALDLRADAGLRVDDAGEVAARFTIGPQLHPPHAYDADRDGVPDDDDLCPRTPEDRDGYADDDGCPDPDDDGDGVEDLADACPRLAEDRDGFLDGDGCPEPDNDGDGIPDALDVCPLEPEDVDGYQDRDGCLDADNDGDHLYDDVDRCPNVPEDEDGFEDTDGCPDPDNDGDGVGDRFDAAPDAPETINGYRDDDGVPDELPPILQRVIGPRPSVTFARGALTMAAAADLDLTAAALMSFPSVTLHVHAPTEDEARLVVEHLVGQGVAAERVTIDVVDEPGPGPRITLSTGP